MRTQPGAFRAHKHEGERAGAGTMMGLCACVIATFVLGVRLFDDDIKATDTIKRVMEVITASRLRARCRNASQAARPHRCRKRR